MDKSIKVVQEFYNQKYIPSVWKCEICEHEYLGFKKPDKCPFCNVDSSFLVNPEVFEMTSVTDLNVKTKENAIKALETEVRDEAFYRRCEEEADSFVLQTYFRAARRHEGYHKDYIAELLQIEPPDLPTTFDFAFPETDFDMLRISSEIEHQAVIHYNEAAELTDNRRAYELFSSFADVEFHHRNMFEDLKEI